jgi:hypothetical protein
MTRTWMWRIVPLALATSVAGLAAAGAVAAVPANTTKPTISGTVREGQTLTVSNGTWQNAPTSYRYQWQRCDATGVGCVNLASQTQQTYTLDADDVGKTLRAVVTAVNADGNASATSETTAPVPSASAPRNTTKPSISGVAKVGEELAADRGVWTGAPDRYAYQWERCDTAAACVDIVGATGQTYGVRSADINRQLRVTVKATNEAGSATASSNTTSTVPGPPVVNRRPQITLLRVTLIGPRVYARFRVCDDSRKNLTIVQQDRRIGLLPYTRRFSTVTPPLPCGSYTRNWKPAPRFRDGRQFVITLQARDKSAAASVTVRRTIRFSS